jgi:hypothetical protein
MLGHSWGLDSSQAFEVFPRARLIQCPALAVSGWVQLRTQGSGRCAETHDDSGKFREVETDQTEFGAKTMGLDSQAHSGC